MLPIEDYAAIGDGRSVALVGRNGSLDWLCWPRFDSPSLFGAILDERAGHWRLGPRGAHRARRRYLPGTNVLETTFETGTGELRLTDFMSVESEEEKKQHLSPDHEIVRIVECVKGEVEVHMELAPRPDYGARPVAFRRSALGVRAELDDAALLALQTNMPIEVRPDRVIGAGRLRAGESCECALDFEDEWPATLPAPGHAKDALRRTVAWWRWWVEHLDYEGPGRELVERSALVLKLLVYAPSGAIVAAPTTSLPERIGGDLNWDYRFCWLRDASLTVRALFGLGFPREAEAFVSWLLHATRLTWPKLRILYDVHGECPGAERTLDHLDGYRGSKPVRIGNAAIAQTQLDVYGEVIDAVTRSVREGARLDRSTQKMLLAFGDYVCRHGGEPDEGIWEPRSGARHNTHSRLLCWTALDRLLALREGGHLPDGIVARFRESRDRFARDIREGAWNEKLGSYVSTLGGDELDASLLLLAWYGFEPADSPRMRATRARIREHLGAPGGLLYRYKNADSPGEGAFGLASFWDVEYLALGGGSPEEAEGLFLELLGHANDVGLFAEEIDPATGAAVGNFPQAFTHVGVINAALSLRRAA
ncbi:MAG: glycoside hydrolase family 15 protein [Planctomycetota bacterium]